MELSFGEVVRNKRLELGLPLRKVAAKADIDPSTLGKIERGERKASEAVIGVLSEMLQFEKEELNKKYYAERVVYELQELDNYKDVLTLAETRLEYIKSKQLELIPIAIGIEKDWRKKDLNIQKNKSI